MRRAAGVAMLVAGAVTAAAPATAGAAGPRFAPRLHHDPADPSNAALDLRGAAFGQVGTQLSLTLRAGRAWSAGDSACVTLARDRRVGRLCVSADRSRHPKVQLGARTVRGATAERSGRTVRALI